MPDRKRRSLTFLGHSVGQLLQIRPDEIRSRFVFAAVLSAIELLGESHERRALNAVLAIVRVLDGIQGRP